MSFVQIPKDIDKIKTKVAFGLTLRQLIGFLVAGVLGIPAYLLVRKFAAMDVAVLALIIADIPVFFVTFYERDGMTCEEYCKYIYLHKFYQPKIRVKKARRRKLADDKKS